MALFSRRFALLAIASASAVVASVAGPITTAGAADPITTDPAPTLTAPADDPNGVNPIKDLVLSWTKVAHATHYQVQLSPNGDWTNNVVTLPNNGTTVATTYEMPLSLPHGSYFWRVRGQDAAANGPWSLVRTLTRGWPGNLTMLFTPTSSDPSLAWQPVPEASMYEVRFSTDRTFPDDKTLNCFTSSTFFTPYITNAQSENTPGGCFSVTDMKDGARYYWLVGALDDSTATTIGGDDEPDPTWPCKTAQPECGPGVGGASPFTFNAPQAGTIDRSAVPTGLTTSWSSDPGGFSQQNTCGGGGATCMMTPTFAWDPVAGANYYRVTVWRDADHTNVYRVYETSWPEITPRDALLDAQAGAGYYWSVEAGTCQNPGTDFCAIPGTASSPTSPPCTTPGTSPSPPVVTGLNVIAGGTGPTSMVAGSTATIALTGSNLASAVCVLASTTSGLISNTTFVNSGEVDFDYTAPTTAGNVTFQAVNPDGGTSAASPALTVTGSFSRIVLDGYAPDTAFKKASFNVPLTSPANHAILNGTSPLTYQWGSYLGGGLTGGYDARNYHLQVSTDPDFGTTVIDDPDIDLTQFTNPAATLPDGVYYWRVQAIDESGNPLTWSSTFSFTRDATPPKFTLTDSNGVAVNAKLHVSASEADLFGGVSQSTLNVFPLVGSTAAIAGTWASTGATTWTFTPSRHLVVGQSYGLRVVGSSLTDAAGNVAVASSRSVRATTIADDPSPAWTYGTGALHHSASGALGGTYVRLPSGISATIAIVGNKALVYGCRAPGFAKLVVVIDGHAITTLNEHQSFTKCGLLLWSGAITTTAVHTLRLVASGGAASVDEVRVG